MAWFMSSISTKIHNRIKGKGRGWVFGPADFLDLATRDTVDQTLSRLVKQDKIRRLGRGVYDFPKVSKMFGIVPPDSKDIARVLVGGDAVLPSGAMAANILHLSTQVPAKPVFLTKNKSLKKTIDGRQITLKKSRIPILDNVPCVINLLLQALYYIGKNNIDDKIISQCADSLSDSAMMSLKKSMKSLPSWLCDIIHKIDDLKYGKVSTIS
jgi:hypothetical protein